MAACRKVIDGLKNQLLLVCTVAGVAIGLALGFGIRELHPSSDAVLWIGMPGELFIRMIKAVVVPLVVSSIISGASSLDPRTSGKLGGLAVGYNILSNLIGSILGVMVFYIFKPGKDNDSSLISNYGKKSVKLSTHDMFADLLRNIFPSNIVSAAFEKTQTKYRLEQTEIEHQNSTVIESYVRYVSTSGGANILGLIVVSLAIGLAAGRTGEKAKPFLRVFEALTETTMTLLQWIVWVTPIGVASLISKSLVVVDDLNKTFSSVGIFIAALSVGMLIHHLILIPVVYVAVFRRSPLHYLFTSLRPIITAFAPPSSAMAIPDACQVAETKHHVDERISRFVIPLGAATNRIGSSLFICLSVLFFALLEDRYLESAEILIVIILTTLSALGVPAVASGSIVVFIIILSQLNINSKFVGLLMAVDWYCDRIRTTSNITTTLLGSLIINKLCNQMLQDLDSSDCSTDNSDCNNKDQKNGDCSEKQRISNEENLTLL